LQVRFYATFRPIVGGKTVEVAVPAGASVRELVEAIVARFPAMGPILLDATGEIPRGVHVFVNGRGAGYLPDGWQTRLTPDDSIDLFPAVAGG
jgi:molybdopterin synthase sulfur carrier subunit